MSPSSQIKQEHDERAPERGQSGATADDEPESVEYLARDGDVDDVHGRLAVARRGEQPGRPAV